MVLATLFCVEESLWEFENYNTRKVLEVNWKMVSGISTYTIYIMLLTTFPTVSI